MPETRISRTGARKFNRNKNKCERYQREHRRERNKIVRLKAMIKNLSPENKMRIQMEKRIEELTAIAKEY